MDALNSVVLDFDFYHCVNRSGFVFTTIDEPANVLDAIVIRNPEGCDCWTPKKTFSKKSIGEHIEVINRYKLEKAMIIADDISFITQCPTLKYLKIVQANTVSSAFNYSPLYEMPEIKYLSAETEDSAGIKKCSAVIDYSKINGLLEVRISGNGHQNYNQLDTLERLYVSNSIITDLTDMKKCKNLKKIDIFKTEIKDLRGIDAFSQLQQLSISYERALNNMSEITGVSKTLRALAIENCPRITDFSFLEQMVNLEHLELRGKNKLLDLNFLNKMPRLKTFSFSMEIESGDLSPCLTVPYVWCMKNRKSYNLKDRGLPKELNKKGFEIW